MKKDVIQFLHDAGAMDELKHAGLRVKFEAEGYGIFWMIIEILRREKEYRIELRQIEILQERVKPYSDKFNFSAFLEYCYDEELLSKDDKYLWSDSLLRRMQAFNDAREKMSQGAKKARSRDKARQDASTMQAPLKEDININTNTNRKETTTKTQKQIEEDAKSVLKKLNEVTGKRYRDTSKIIDCRIGDGYTRDELIELIDKKIHDTGFVEKGFMSPDIIFGAKIDRYINETMKELKSRQGGFTAKKTGFQTARRTDEMADEEILRSAEEMQKGGKR